MRRGGIGRFAPSPNGPLHAGSLVAALASHASIRADGGQFTVRIDDLDTGRVVPAAQRSILDTLHAFGMRDDTTPLVRQSDRRSRYHQALRELTGAGLVYRCSCSRRQLAGHAVYPGICRANTLSIDELDERLASEGARSTTDESSLQADRGPGPPGSKRSATRPRLPSDAWRVHLHGHLRFTDAVQGDRHVTLERDIGDIVVLRRDGIVAWPLATACDDADPTTEVVRGADLLDPTPAQVALLERLGRTPPRYAHVPVLEDGAQRKLGKSTRAPGLDATRALPLLQQAWAFLGQTPIDADDVAGFHASTPSVWSCARVPRVVSRHHPGLAG